MPRAYKLPNAAATISEIETAQEVLNDLQTRARELAASIGSARSATTRPMSSSAFRTAGRSPPTGGAT
jgi:hypothetical protein